jgi:hypothetical protein
MPFSMLHDVYEYLGKTSFGSGGAWARAKKKKKPFKDPNIQLYLIAVSGKMIIGSRIHSVLRLVGYTGCSAGPRPKTQSNPLKIVQKSKAKKDLMT